MGKTVGMKKFGFCLKEFFKSYIKFVVFYLFMILVLICVTWLYGDTIEPVVYSIEIISFFTLVWGIYEFIKFYKKHERLYSALNNTVFNIDSLDKSKNLIEADYQNIICKLKDEVETALTTMESNYNNQVDYYSMWVHQIKTPISAVNLLLQSSTLDIEISKAMKQELFKIEQYVEMVLQYLRIENITSDLKLQEYELYDIVKQAIKKYSIIFINKKISLNLQEFKCNVLTDEKWLSFIIEQILSNALKYTFQGTIHIYALQEEKALIIEDTGIGIKREDIERIFENGFTGYNGRMEKKSSGIGLYLCKQAAEKLSHKIIITSEVGKGTKVKIMLSSDKLELY